jgi:MoaA/NifB/PqqE/SkfB family radical SAM enzyme
MSTPHAKHGSPTPRQLAAIADQLAEYGIFDVRITGGESLIRADLRKLVDALAGREIGINTIFSNGWLVDGALLDRLEERNLRLAFQLSFDGIGRHDHLRGVPGAQERTVAAIRLLREREYRVAMAVAMHRNNRPVPRETIRLLASLGAESVKCGVMMDMGDWARPKVHDLHMTYEEDLKMHEEYIPRHFADDAPVRILLAGTLSTRQGSPGTASTRCGPSRKRWRHQLHPATCWRRASTSARRAWWPPAWAWATAALPTGSRTSSRRP